MTEQEAYHLRVNAYLSNIHLALCVIGGLIFIGLSKLINPPIDVKVAMLIGIACWIILVWLKESSFADEADGLELEHRFKKLEDAVSKKRK